MPRLFQSFLIYMRRRLLPIKDPARKATGEECLLIRWADPDDTIKVRIAHNKAYLERIKTKYNIDPINSLRRRLLDFHEQDQGKEKELI